MNPRKQPNRGPRPGPSTKPAGKPSKYYWYRHCYPWYDYDYDWNDYDYDWYDYTMARRAKASAAEWEETDTVDSVAAAYQQGFKDGWIAAMEYAYYGEGKTMPESAAEPVPVPVSPTEKPAE